MRAAVNRKVSMAVLVVLGLAACQQQASAPAETADEFVERLNKDFAVLHVEGAQAGWV